MKALTVWQPWASLILGQCRLSRTAWEIGLSKPKDVENRPWGTSHRGDLLIHAGKRVDDGALMLIRDTALPTGALLGVVELYECSSPLITCGSPWAGEGQFHWRLRYPRVFEDPIPYRGAQGLFEVPDEVIADAMQSIKGRATA